MSLKIVVIFDCFLYKIMIFEFFNFVNMNDIDVEEWG